MSEGVGDVFQRSTKYFRGQVFGRLLWSEKPEVYKSYPVEKIPLSVDFATKSNSRMPLSEAIKHRKSIRHYTSEPLSFSALSYLLWASTGIRKQQNNPYEFRTAPSAGALYPIETYIAANHIQNLTQGLYHYNIKQNALEQIKTGNFAEDIAHAALDQEMCQEAPALIIWTAVFPRQKWKYQQRAYRYAYIDAGHIAQNLALAATSLELGTCQIGAFYDDELNELLQVDGINETAIYLSTIGHPLQK